MDRSGVDELFENALRYAPKSGTISFRYEHHDEMVKTIIANDVSDGLTLDDALFERFQRGEVSRSREYGEAGLGLAIVRQLVEAHGGRAGISLVKGRAEVWFELPGEAT